MLLIRPLLNYLRLLSVFNLIIRLTFKIIHTLTNNLIEVRKIYDTFI